MRTLVHEMNCDDGLHSCLVEDNGRVAYAYLVREGRIIGDLWLYNRAESPVEPEWRERTKMPFLNPVAFVDTMPVSQPLLSGAELAAEWEIGADGVANSVRIYLRGRLYGVLAPAANPGWCVAALKDGPLAKRFTNTPSAQSSI